ncbi:MAG: hypothetical protein WCV70_03940 [Patescibacteria group bacterium]|jgi:hypothetical protein
MKKVLVILTMAMLVLPFAAMPTKAEDTAEAVTISAQEEKISTPAEIKNFTKIRKMGEALYGYRMIKTMIAKLEEKIPNLAEIKNFTKIRKMGNSLYGYKKMNDVISSTEISAEAIACVQAALIKKDNAVISALDAYTAAIKTAMETRKNAYVAALAISDKQERTKAMVNAFTAYRKAKNEAKDKYKESVKTVFDAYKTDLKSCKVEMGQDLNTSEADSDL